MHEGLSLWNAVAEVDRAYTKPITGREFKGNSVNLTYTTKKLTEALGPAGDRWGWEVVDERVHEYGSHELQNFVAIHAVRVRLWFRRDDGTFGHIEDYGTTKLAYYAGQGGQKYLKVDEEACKKSISDAKSKLFVALGGSAELWLGEFDGSQHKYVGDDAQSVNDHTRQPRPAPPRIAALKSAVATHDEADPLLIDRVNNDEALHLLRRQTRQLLEDGDTAKAAALVLTYKPRFDALGGRYAEVLATMDSHIAQSMEAARRKAG